MNRRFSGWLVVASLGLVSLCGTKVALAGAPGWCGLRVGVASAVYGEASGSTRRPSSYDATDSTEGPDVRERRVGGRFPLEKELATDRSWDTWLYVFTALMALCVGWLCFKPHRVATGKGGGGFSLLRRKGDARKGKRGKK